MRRAIFLLLWIGGGWLGQGCEPEPDLTNTEGYGVNTDENGRHSITVLWFSDHFLKNGLRLKNVVELNIEGDSPAPLPGGLLKRLIKIRTLRALRLPYRTFSDEEFALLSDDTGRISTLDLDQSNVTDNVLKHLAYHENLKIVSVVLCKGITSRGVLDFAKTSAATNLYVSKGVLSKDERDFVGKLRPGLLVEINEQGYGSVIGKP